MYILVNNYGTLVSSGATKRDCVMKVFSIHLKHDYEYETIRVIVNGDMLPLSYGFDHEDNEVIERVIREDILPKITKYGYRLFKQV